MSPSLSWIDERHWRRLLQRSGIPAPGTGPAVPGGGARQAPAPSRAPASATPAAWIDPAPAAGERPPEYRGNLDQRLQQLLFWIGRQTGADALFVADDAGLPLLTVGPVSDLVAASALLSKAYAKLWPPGGEGYPAFTCLLFAESRILTITEVSTPWGRFALGFVCGGFTAPGLLHRIRRELGNAFEEKEKI